MKDIRRTYIMSDGTEIPELRNSVLLIPESSRLQNRLWYREVFQQKLADAQLVMASVTEEIRQLEVAKQSDEIEAKRRSEQSEAQIKLNNEKGETA